LTISITTTFADLGVDPDLVDVLAEGGIHQPFPVQTLTIPDALAGHDVCGKARTGSGKTLAFGLPLVQRVEPGAGPGRPRALVLVPTRELAAQVATVLVPLGAARRLTVADVYGGASMNRQREILRSGAEIVVATPGRLIDLLDQGELVLDDVAHLVVDEADRMADMGFLPQVEWILRRVTAPHQTMLFSATLDGGIDHLVRQHLRDPAFHEVVEAGRTVQTMVHRFLLVHHMDKVLVAAAVASGADRVLMFTNTKRAADRLAKDLRTHGVTARAIHGDLPQRERERALQGFAQGSVPVLVATDVAARGIHVDGVDVVVHFDVPDDHKTYVHRSGRTARAGNEGIVVTFVLWDQELEVERLQRRLGLREPIVEVFSNDPRLADLATIDGPAPKRRAVSA
jgi:superfamily II DNA/RNA helicase